MVTVQGLTVSPTLQQLAALHVCGVGCVHTSYQLEAEGPGGECCGEQDGI